MCSRTATQRPCTVEQQKEVLTCIFFYRRLIFQGKECSDKVMQLKQDHMSVRPSVTRPYHNQASLQQTCSQCGGSMCFKRLFSALALTPCQYSCFSETEHSDRDGSETGRTFTDKLWPLTMRTFRLVIQG